MHSNLLLPPVSVLAPSLPVPQPVLAVLALPLPGLHSPGEPPPPPSS